MSAVPDTLRWGVGLALGAALISGFSVIVNAAAVRQFPDPAVYTTLKNGVATVILTCLVASGPGPRAVRAMDRRAWARLTVIGIVGGSVPFLLFFTGLAQASAPSAAFIQKTLFVWVAVLAVPFLGERLGWVQVAAFGLLLAGQALVAPPSGLAWGGGETLIAAATVLWAIEVVLAKRLLESVAVPLVAAGRLGLGMVVLVAYLATTGRLGILADLRTDHWLSTLITGAILAAYVAMWLGALRRAPAGLVTAVLVVGAPITAVVEAMMTRGAFPDAPVVVGGLLIITASACLVGLSVRARAPSSKIEPGPAAA